MLVILNLIHDYIFVTLMIRFILIIATFNFQGIIVFDNMETEAFSSLKLLILRLHLFS